MSTLVNKFKQSALVNLLIEILNQYKDENLGDLVHLHFPTNRAPPTLDLNSAPLSDSKFSTPARSNNNFCLLLINS